jgi:hypothetical protein
MYDISMLSRDQVLALINQENSLTLTFNEVEFGIPVISSGTEGRDTELVVTGIPNSGYTGTKTIYYNRINLNDFTTLLDPEQELILQIDGEVTVQKILDAFNAFFGSNLQLDDLRDDLTIPPSIENGVLFSLVASANSLAYRGSIEVTLQPMDVDLETAINVATLNGLTLNAPSQG